MKLNTTWEEFITFETPSLPKIPTTTITGTIANTLVMILLFQGSNVQLINPSLIICPAIVHTIPALCPENNIDNAKTNPAAGEI